METLAIRLIAWAWVITVPAVLLLRSELIMYRIPFYTISFAVLLGFIGLFLLALSVMLGLIKGNGFGINTIAFVALGLVLVTPAAIAIKSGTSVPLIHDITTDLEQPPVYDKILSLRRASDNSLELDDKVMEMQSQHYTNILPLEIVGSKQDTFAQSLEQAEAMGWEVVSQDLDRGHIEAVVSTRLMGFKDDVVIRIRQQDETIRVDLRSASRVGDSDLGANAARIVSFLDGLRARVAN